MWDYIVFWVSKAVAEVLIVVAVIVGLVVAFYVAASISELRDKRKRWKKRRRYRNEFRLSLQMLAHSITEKYGLIADVCWDLDTIVSILVAMKQAVDDKLPYFTLDSLYQLIRAFSIEFQADSLNDETNYKVKIYRELIAVYDYDIIRYIEEWYLPLAIQLEMIEKVHETQR